jgi:hypothetical protein
MNNSGEICRLTDDSTMLTPLENTKRYSYPTNKNPMDRLLLWESRLLHLPLLRNGNIGGQFQAFLVV